MARETEIADELAEELDETTTEAHEEDTPPAARPRKPRTTKPQARARAREAKAAMERGGTTDVSDTWTENEGESGINELSARVEHLEAKNRNGSAAKERARARQQEIEEKEEEEELPPLDVERDEDEPLPIELISPRGATDPYLSVIRVEANGPGRGYDDGSEYTGPCGNVIHRTGFEEEIRRRWGGGHYKVTARVKGKTIVAPLVFNGIASLPVDEQELGAAEPAVEWDPRMGQRPGYSPYQAHAPGGFQPPFATGYGQQQPGFQPPYTGPGAHGGLPPGWTQAPGGGYWSPWGYSSTPPNPATVPQQMAQAWPKPGAENEQITLMRDELEKTRQEAAEARKQGEIEKIRAEFQAREKDLTSKIELLVSEVRSKRDDSGGISDLIKIQAQQWEREREDRRLKQEEERVRRDEEHAREERQRREDRDKAERDAKERREREERDFRDREVRLREERERDTKQREQADRQLEKLMSAMYTNQPKLTEILGMVQTVKEMAGPDDTFSKVTQMVETVAALKDLADHRETPEETGMDKAQRMIEAVGRAVTPALGEVAKMMGKKQQEAEAPQEQEQVYYQPAPQALPVSDQPQAQQRPAPVVQQVSAGDLTPQQWGKVLRFVVDAYQSKSDPDETASHLFTMLRAFDAIQAAEQIGGATVETFKAKVTLLKLSGKITDAAYLAYMDRFVQMCSDKQSAEWIGTFIGYVKNTCLAIRKRVADAQAKVNAEAAQEAAAEDEDEGDE